MSEPTRQLRIPVISGEPTSQPTRAASQTPPPVPVPVEDTPDVFEVTRVSDASIPRPPSDLPVVFPGYEILGELGRGGMGVVYRARQRSLNRPVALKVILAGPHASDADKARFKLEAEAGARLKHPNIVQVYDVGDHAGFGYIAFELIDGQTLRQWQGRQPADPREAARIISALARGLHHAHEHGIIHRDVKPANVLLAGNADCGTRTAESRSNPATAPTNVNHGASPVKASVSHSALRTPQPTFQPKLTDFGLAKPIDGGLDLTITGMACGTPNYMAPEQIRGRSISPAADVYGLGAVLFELLTGHPPFRGTDPAQVMEKILRLDPDRARRLNPSVPRDLEVIAAKCLEKDPTRRYGSAADLADDLDRFLAGHPIHARAVGITERTWRWCRRNPVVTTFLILSTLACAATGKLAFALSEAVAVERNARAESDQARDDLRSALLKEEAARTVAENEKAAANAARRDADIARQRADEQKANAVAQAEIAKEQTRRANEERDRANGNLRVLRSLVRNSFRDLTDNPRLQGPEFRGFRVGLIRTGTAFYKTLEAQAGHDPDALAELGDCAHFLGYFEFLNGNMDAAAAHYQNAADVYYRWMALDPEDPEPRARMASALTNTGNALLHAGRLDRIEPRYRDAIALLEWVADRHPKNESYLLQLVRAYPPLYEFLREQKRWADGAAVCRAYLKRSQDLVQRVGPRPGYLLDQARAHQCLGQMLDRTDQTDEAEGHFYNAISLRQRVRDRIGYSTEHKAEAAQLWYVLGQHFMFAKQSHRIPEATGEAIQLAEEVCDEEPHVPRHFADLADYCLLEASYLRWTKKYPQAEARFDRAIEAAELALARKPSPGLARSTRSTWASAMTGRAHLYNATNRHREAAAQWEKLAAEDPNPAIRPTHALFVLQSLNFAGDWRAAAAGADKLAEGEPAPSLLVDLAKVWCRVARLVNADEDLSPDDRKSESESALKKAVSCLERAKKAGLFKNPGMVEYFDTDRDFDPIRNRFTPRDE